MMGIELGTKIYLSCTPCDMRKSIDSLASLVQLQFGMDPFNNSPYVFCNKGCNKCKILRWSNNGWWLYYRKLSKGVFRWEFDQGKWVLEVSERQFRWLMDGMSMTPCSAMTQAMEIQQLQAEIYQIIDEDECMIYMGDIGCIKH